MWFILFFYFFFSIGPFPSNGWDLKPFFTTLALLRVASCPGKKRKPKGEPCQGRMLFNAVPCLPRNFALGSVTSPVSKLHQSHGQPWARAPCWLLWERRGWMVSKLRCVPLVEFSASSHQRKSISDSTETARGWSAVNPATCWCLLETKEPLWMLSCYKMCLWWPFPW